MGPITLPQGGRITNRQELEGARATRRELVSQIDASTDRRGTLVQQRHNADATGNRTVVAEYDAQIAELGQRVRQLERQKAQLDDAIMDAVRRGVGQEISPPGAPVEIVHVPPVPPPPGEAITLLPPPGPQMSWLQINAERLLSFGALTFLLASVLIWRIARRGRRAPELQGATEMRQAIDAIAVEVERISENQRYVTKLIADRLGDGAAHSIEANAKDRVEVSQRSK